MDYSKVLKNSWQTIWKHKVIIWFGFMMAIPSIIMGLIMGGFFFFFNEENFPFFFNPYASEPDINLIFIILFIVAIFAFTILSYALMALSFAGVLKGTFDLEKREDSISFNELWEATLPYLGRVFGVFFLVFFLIFAFFGIIMFFGALVGAVTAGLGFICLMPLFLLIIPLELIAYLYASLAMATVIAEDVGVFDALKHAWEVMKQKFWQLVLMGIILVFVQWVLTMIVMLPMQVAQFAFIFSADMTNSIPDPSTFFQPFAILMAILIPVMSLIQGLGLTYANAAWMLTYLNITAEPSED